MYIPISPNLLKFALTKNTQNTHFYMNTEGIRKNRIDCLLVMPFYKALRGPFRVFDNVYPPLSLCYLSAYLKNKGFSTKIVDCNTEFSSQDDFESYLEKLSAKTEISFAGFTAATATINAAIKASVIFKKYFPGTKIILGGPHINFDFTEALSHPTVDYAVLGEGEITLGEIVEGKKPENINGIVFKNENGEFIKTSPRERISNIDILPFPDYEALNIDKYNVIQAVPLYKTPSVGIITSRGCPGNCTFCSRTIKGKTVHHSANYIFQLILHLYDVYKIKQVVFLDDTFTDDQKFLEELCRLFINSDSKFAWTCQSRIDTVDTSLLKLMKQAGCLLISYGVESIDDGILKSINKKINTAQVTEVLKLTREAKILSRTYIMVGHLKDTLETIRTTMKRLKSLKTDFVTVSVSSPLPGSPLFEQAKKMNLITSYNWDHYDWSFLVMKHPVLTEEDIYKYINKIYLSFYLRFSFAFRMLKMISSWEGMKKIFIGMVVFIKLLREQVKIRMKKTDF